MLSLDPAYPLEPGSLCEVVLTTGTASSGSAALATPHVVRFNAAVNPNSPGHLAPATRRYISIGKRHSIDAAIADLDGDGDRDICIGG